MQEELDYGIDNTLLFNSADSEEVQQWRDFHHLTLLHQAVICRDIQKVAVLLRNGADPNATDRRLWTPLHHAALKQDEEMIALLLSAGADAKRQNDYGGTFQDIVRLVTPPDQRVLTTQPLLFFKDSKGLTSWDIPHYETATHTLFVDENVISPTRLLHLWRDFGKNIPPKRDSLADYQKWRADLYKLKDSFLIASATDQMPHERIDVGLGLFAQREYAPFEVVGEYLGAVDAISQDYTLAAGNLSGESFRIDAKNFSNPFSRINDGFPNLFLTSIANERGLPFRPIFVTLESIKPGEQFCFNYGWHGVKKGPYVELRAHALRTFILNHDLDEWTQLLEKIHPFYAKEISQDDIVFMAQFRYILQTPQVLCSLLLDGTIGSKKARRLMRARQKFILGDHFWS